MNIANSFLNAAAVWFILKAVEVIPIALYDVFSAVKKLVNFKRDPDFKSERSGKRCYDTRRGKLEYIASGTGFANLSLWRRSKKWLFISTLVPVVIFVLEIVSIFLGNETRTCKTSTDTDVITAPSLEMFGRGIQQYTVAQLFNETINGGSTLRPCVKWIASYSGVDYYSSLCVDVDPITSYISTVSRFFQANPWVGLMMPKNLGDQMFFPLFVMSMVSPNTTIGATLIGVLFTKSEVLVNGKGLLVKNATSLPIITDERKAQIVEDAWAIETRLNARFSEYVEDENFFGFRWDHPEKLRKSIVASVVGVLAQATRARRKTAAQMSVVNTGASSKIDYDVLCEEDFVLTRAVSISIIVASIAIRLLLMIIPTNVSSAEFALVTAEEIANSEECNVFFMDRRRAVCSQKSSNNGVCNHVGYTSLEVPGENENLPWHGKAAH